MRVWGSIWIQLKSEKRLIRSHIMYYVLIRKAKSSDYDDDMMTHDITTLDVIEKESLIRYKHTEWNLGSNLQKKRKLKITFILLMQLSIWWRPWCLLRRRAWRAHLGGGVWRQFGLPGRRECVSCCSEQGGRPRWRSFRRCRWRMSSRLTLTSWRCQFLGEPAWGHGRCRLRRSQHVCVLLGRRLSWQLPWLGCFFLTCLLWPCF